MAGWALFLNMPGARRARTHLVDFDTGILADDTGTGTWGIEEHTIKSTHDLWELPGVVVADNDVLASHSMDVGGQTLCSLLVAIVRKYRSGVLK